MKNEDFKEWLKAELSKPSKNPHYDPNGNSEHAVVVRGLKREILYQYKTTPNHFKGVFSRFEGFETEIGWFIQIPIYILLLPILPIFWARSNYNRAIRAYKDSYVFELKKSNATP